MFRILFFFGSLLEIDLKNFFIFLNFFCFFFWEVVVVIVKVCFDKEVREYVKGEKVKDLVFKIIEIVLV